MRVFNLTQYEVDYKGRKIPANGGSLDYPTLTFVPSRDLELEAAKVLAFGALPAWWNMEMALKDTAEAAAKQASLPPAPVHVSFADEVSASDKVSVELKKKK